ncbi:hypothetical protein SERLA73DRAFT_92387 [Serpula lacrymans var. lacrymans S7.3]|uniref:L-tryptophan decarboxylase PsiD-like domain-containing protein n=2 Tax=Serpula lacrymans var. lacrymans TaxID=341189 RepID=F8Q2A0_SERL3|nr:uncharacterized protein SERLADRAFT_362309 [Serpula lacrymans var. lacrymans S7.9]EGN97311.1 hypothetical protein SERLA73DRAFT_92387 [Serpula lacrymans var. lacrymans S7.3]EGO22898.1 hypothetical protein SERLADRAFT_362309 [Serpula lacrymans var. lacrymans S7.9]
MPARTHYGGWLPRDHEFLKDWIHKRIEKLGRARSDGDLLPVIKEFKNLIETDYQIFIYFQQGFEQLVRENNDAQDRNYVNNYTTMLHLMNDTIQQAPAFVQSGEGNVIGVPLYAILDSIMNTTGGFAAFVNPKVNLQLYNVLTYWSNYLVTPDSRHVLTDADEGWFGLKATSMMPNFAETYVCQPDKPYHGFTSWDEFFTRLFRPGKRPVFPDEDNFINNACESTVFRKASDVKENDTFWLKGQPYSLVDMLNNDSFAPQFAGGTVYQAFLSPLDYHRWHSPVNGTIEKTVLLPGTYYSAVPDNEGDGAIIRSQPYITAVAARALIFIRSSNPSIGLMCFVGVGMVEVSSCEIIVNPGDKVSKGQQIGMFHFGGSTHCLIFRPETKLVFTEEAGDDKHVEVNLGIAHVTN